MTTPSIDKLCRRWRRKLPEAAIVEAVCSAFPELQHSEPPLDVRKLAARRGVVAIRKKKMSLDGKISLLSQGRYLIELNEAHPKTRQRFTSAHEIGHTFFFELDDELTLRSRFPIEDKDLERVGTDTHEEALCNIAAAEILMPTQPFSARVRSLGPSADGILSLSRHFGTSLWSTARRFVQTSPFRLLIAL